MVEEKTADTAVTTSEDTVAESTNTALQEAENRNAETSSVTRKFAEETKQEIEALTQMSTQELTERGHKIIRQFLHKRGYTILTESIACGSNTLDFVAEKDSVRTIFVLKTELALGEEDQLPTLNITQRSFRHYRSLLFTYLAQNYVPHLQIDLLSLMIVGVHRARLRHMMDVYDWQEPRDTGLLLDSFESDSGE